jgi:hypothetical protein
MECLLAGFVFMQLSFLTKTDRITKGFNIKKNIIPILMHQMHISTNHVSLVMLRPKSWKSEKKSESCDRANKNQNREP